MIDRWQIDRHIHRYIYLSGVAEDKGRLFFSKSNEKTRREK
jgi:hypothetical protein